MSTGAGGELPQGLEVFSGSLRRLTGFGFLIGKGASRGVLRHAEQQLKEMLTDLGRVLVPLRQASEQRGAVIIELLDEASPDQRLRHLSRLNQSRDALGARAHVLILLVLEDELSRIAQSAPDLWSVRTRIAVHHQLSGAAKPRSNPLDLSSTLHPVPVELATLCASFSLQGLELRDDRDRSLPRTSMRSLYQQLQAAGPPLAEHSNLASPIGEVAALFSRYRFGLLTGDAGSGKTTALKIFAERLSRAGQQVILVSLAALSSSRIGLLEPDRALSTLASLCAWQPALEKRPWLLLDGLDELDDWRRRRDLLLLVDDLLHLDRVQGAIVASRPESLRQMTAHVEEGASLVNPVDVLPKLRLLPFNDDQIKAYFRAWVELAIDEQERELQLATLYRTVGLGNPEQGARPNRLRGLCRRPLFLATVAALVRRLGVEPESEYQVLHALVDALIHRRKAARTSTLSASDVRQLAGEVAWQLHELRSTAERKDRLLERSELLDQGGLQALRLSTGLLAEDVEVVRFAHAALQEVLVAEQAVDRVGWQDHEKLARFVWRTTPVRRAGATRRSGTQREAAITLQHTGVLTVERMAELAPRAVASFITTELGDDRLLFGLGYPIRHVVDLVVEVWGARPSFLMRRTHEEIRERLWVINRDGSSYRNGSRISAIDLARLGDCRIGETTFVVLTKGWEIAKWPVPRRLYAEFMEEDGYGNRAWWDRGGLKWKNSSSSRDKSRPDRWDSPGFTEPWQPVVGLSRHEARAFVSWYRQTRDSRVCLPSRALWEEAAAGTELPKRSTIQSAPGPIGGTPHLASRAGVEDMGGLVRQWLAPAGGRKEHWGGWAFCDDSPCVYTDSTGRWGRRWYHPFGLRLAREPIAL